MSLKTLPLLFVNLGGEMIYILDQRLKAQSIQPEKARKVMRDITGTMFNKRFMEELFKPQELYSKKAMRAIFDKLAHASIMRLNTASMDKLYDLMTMALKYQVSMCSIPSDIQLVTFNHMDAIREFVSDSPAIKQQVEYVYKLLAQHYASLSPGEFMLIKQTLLNFFQDIHIRVSIFLKDKVQSQNGRFVIRTSGLVPHGTDIPGTIRLFNSRGEPIKTMSFSSGGTYQKSTRQGSIELNGDRVTRLGTNMYTVTKPVETLVSGAGKATYTVAESEPSVPNPHARAQLDLLSKLIGVTTVDRKSSKQEIRLNLYNTDEEEQAAGCVPVQKESRTRVISIDATKKSQNAELTRIMGELKVDPSGDDTGPDLLDLMDSTQ